MMAPHHVTCRGQHGGFQQICWKSNSEKLGHCGRFSSCFLDGSQTSHSRTKSQVSHGCIFPLPVKNLLSNEAWLVIQFYILIHKNLEMFVMQWTVSVGWSGSGYLVAIYGDQSTLEDSCVHPGCQCQSDQFFTWSLIFDQLSLSCIDAMVLALQPAAASCRLVPICFGQRPFHALLSGGAKWGCPQGFPLSKTNLWNNGRVGHCHLRKPYCSGRWEKNHFRNTYSFWRNLSETSNLPDLPVFSIYLQKRHRGRWTCHCTGWGMFRWKNCIQFDQTQGFSCETLTNILPACGFQVTFCLKGCVRVFIVCEKDRGKINKLAKKGSP